MPALRLHDGAAGKQACTHRSPGSFMTSIITRFLTAGSAIMSFSSCARAQPCHAARWDSRRACVAQITPLHNAWPAW